MKRLIIVISLFLLSAFVSHAYNREKYDSLYNAGIDHMTHGRTEQCSKAFHKILRSCKLSMVEEQTIYVLLAVNADLAGDYSAQYKYLKKKEGKAQPSKAREFATVLSQQPRQVIKRPDKDVVVEYIIDSLFTDNKYVGCEIRLPVTIGGKQEQLILDNGCAKFCAASNSFALEHGIRPIGSEGNAFGVTGTSSVWFGICDELRLGELTFRNIIFTVIPDDAIDNSILNINGMLGASIFRLAGEMVFDNIRRTITFPVKQKELEANVMIDQDGVHYVAASVEGIELPLQFDLGSARTSLGYNYFKANEEHIKSTWTEKTAQVGGVGGMKETLNYAIEELLISSCGGTFVRKGLEVSTSVNSNGNQAYGSLGNDFLLSFKTAVINLKKMFIYVE